MQVVFYYNTSDSRTINKNLIDGETFEGQARDEVDVMNPVIRFDTNQILKYNYAYIPELQRYYSVVNRTIFREGLWDVTFAVDVLMSSRNDILNTSAVVDKQSMIENGDQYIDDGSLVTDNLMFTTTTEYPDGFNDTVEYVLIVAG
jgi:hypothetical protein